MDGIVRKGTLNRLGRARVPRTYGGDDEHYEEGIEHGHNRRDERRDDVLERLDSPEEPNHPAKPRKNFIPRSTDSIRTNGAAEQAPGSP